MNVTRATVEDWPFIERLRERYFAGWGQPVQARPNEVVWKIAYDDRGVAGCYSYADAPDYGQRWVLDYFVVGGMRGKRAAIAMWHDARQAAKSEGFESIVGQVHPLNMRQLRFMDSLGFRPVAITMLMDLGGTHAPWNSRPRRSRRFGPGQPKRSK